MEDADVEMASAAPAPQPSALDPRLGPHAVDLAARSSAPLSLDESALGALNLFKSSAAGERAVRDGTLRDVLCKGRTKAGERELERRLRAPSTHPEQIRRWHNYTEALASDADLRNGLFDKSFKAMADMDALIKKLGAGKLANVIALKTLYALHELISRLPGIIELLEAHQGPHRDMLLEDIVRPARELILDDVSRFSELVEATVDMAAAARHEWRVNPSVNDIMNTLTAKLDNNKSYMENLCSEAAGEFGLDDKSVKLTCPDKQGWCMRVTRKDEKAMRDVNKGYIMLETRKDGVYFTSMELKRTAQKRHDLEQQHSAAEQTVLEEAMNVARSFTPSFTKISSMIAELDAALGLARAAVHAAEPYIRPQMLPMGSGVLELKDARHPCVELTSAVAGFIPNDVIMHKDTSRLQIMTGPNMGGKSTYIRMAGVIAVMAQIGSFVPCSSARISILQTILARVGAGDNAQKGMSTFMAEMVEAATIVKQSNPNSLVIIDELGRGTSTYDGFGLAWAIAEHLATETRCLAFFATHYAELTAMASTLDCVRNLHVTAHTSENSITMLYKVQPGPCDRSFGVHVAQVASFPASVVAAARAKAHELELFGGRTDSVLAPLVKEEENVSASSPPSSQESPARGRMGGANSGSKRVQPGPDHDDAPVPVDAFSAALLSRPCSDFQDASGQVDMVKFRAFVQQCRGAKGAPNATDVVPMETA